MKWSKPALAFTLAGSLAFAVPAARAADHGKSGTHRQHGVHKSDEGGKSDGHRQDGSHKSSKGGKSAAHRHDGDHHDHDPPVDPADHA